MAIYVNIISGMLSDGTPISNISLPLNSPIQKKSGLPFGAKFRGSFNSSTCVSGFPFKRVNLRVLFKSERDFSVATTGEETQDQMNIVQQNVSSPFNNTSNFTSIPEDTRTDEEITKDITDKMDVISIITRAIAESSSIRSLVISGSPGTGKSFSVLNEIEKFAKANPFFKFTVLKGSISAIRLFSELWDHREKNNVIILDDCDAVVDDLETLNMIKAATDTSKVRTISYTKLSRYLGENDIPTKFEFNGGIIYLSNINFANEVERKTKLAPHVDAFVSRSLYINVTMNTQREKVLRMVSVIDTDLFCETHSINKEQSVVIKEWILEKQNSLIEISIRTAVKLANIIKSFPTDWEKIAKITLCK